MNYTYGQYLLLEMAMHILTLLGWIIPIVLVIALGGLVYLLWRFVKWQWKAFLGWNWIQKIWLVLMLVSGYILHMSWYGLVIEVVILMLIEQIIIYILSRDRVKLPIFNWSRKHGMFEYTKWLLMFNK